jgi:DNA gyrase subunit A
MSVFHPGDIQPIDLEQEMRQSYMDYAMSVIVSRALPDVRDGLKPVQRRILYAMLQEGITAGGRTKKSAAIVGEVMKNYHPHGDQSIYDTLARLVQPWVMRYPLVTGQGNFGSVDGDPPAAQRYTEAKMSAVAMTMVEDIDKDTVDMVETYLADPTVLQPSVLPALLPNLLVNGASGIAVGMATNIPPHNLGEVVDALVRLIDDPEISTEDLVRIIPGPDFPTGGMIYARDIAQVYATGHGRIVMRAQVEFEESRNGREQIIVRELPYQVNKARLLASIAELVNDKKLEGIADLRDESGRTESTRIVIELKPSARPHTVLANLFKHTQLQNTFGALMLALVDGRPQVLGLKAILQPFIDFRRQVVVRRTRGRGSGRTSWRGCSSASTTSTR